MRKSFSNKNVCLVHFTCAKILIKSKLKILSWTVMLKGIVRQILKKNDWRNHSAHLVLHKEVRDFTQALRHNLATLAISTFGLAIALTWSDVVKSIINEVFPQRQLFTAQISVAIIVTLFSVTFTYLISRFTKKV